MYSYFNMMESIERRRGFELPGSIKIGPGGGGFPGPSRTAASGTAGFIHRHLALAPGSRSVARAVGIQQAKPSITWGQGDSPAILQVVLNLVRLTVPLLRKQAKDPSSVMSCLLPSFLFLLEAQPRLRMADKRWNRPFPGRAFCPSLLRGYSHPSSSPLPSRTQQAFPRSSLDS